MPSTFQVVGNLVDFGNAPRVGVQVRAHATPPIKVGDTGVHSDEPDPATTDETGQFTLTLVSLPGVWYRIRTPYSNAIRAVNLAGYVPDAADPRTGTPFPDGTVINVKDIVDEDPTPGYEAIAFGSTTLDPEALQGVVRQELASAIGHAKPSFSTLNFDTVYTGSDRITWLSEDGAVVYGYRGPTLLQSTDEWATRQTIKVFDGDALAVRVMQDGQLLVSVGRDEAAGRKAKLYRSSGYTRSNPTAATWTEVLTAVVTKGNFTNPWGMHVYGNIVVVAEYGLQGAQGARCAWISEDGGLTFTLIFDLMTQVVQGRPVWDTDAHVHTVAWDPYWSRVWITVGDQANTACYYSDDKGATWKIATSYSVAGSQPTQYTGIMPLPDTVIFGSDRSPNGVHYYRRGLKSDTPSIKPLLVLNDSTPTTHVFGLPYRKDWDPGTATYFSAPSSLKRAPSVIVGTVDGTKAYVLYSGAPTDSGLPFSGEIEATVGPTVQGNILALMSQDPTVTGQRIMKAPAPTWQPGVTASLSESEVDQKISNFQTMVNTTYALKGETGGDQIDFVELARTASRKYTSMTFVKTTASKYQVRLHDGQKGITYQFVKDSNDDFIKIDSCHAGYGETLQESTAVLVNPDSLTGTWQSATGSSTWYTTVPGQGFTGTVTGTRVEVVIVKESRGGLWHFTIDGGAPIPVSCWSSSAAAFTPVTLASGLTPGPHTVVATFQGNDPANAPSSSPSRGFVKGGGQPALIGYSGAASQTQMILADSSNKEFAFSASLGGTTNWIPEHDAVGSAFKITGPKFWLNGAVVDVAGWAIGQSQAITSFRLDQHFNGKVGVANALEFRTTHAIDNAGMLTFDGTLKCLVDGLSVLAGYPMMLPSVQSTLNEFVSGIGTSMLNLTDESTTYFANERDAVISGAVVSSTNRNLLGAVRLRNPRLAFRRGKTGKPVPGRDLFLWNRAAKPKMYWNSFKDATLNTGDAYAWSFDLMVADTDNVYSMVKG